MIYKPYACEEKFAYKHLSPALTISLKTKIFAYKLTDNKLY